MLRRPVRSRLLEEAMVAARDPREVRWMRASRAATPEGAATAARELAQLADATGIRLVAARAALAQARVAVATGRPADAAEPARGALADFSALAMPLDAGEARLVLARALAVEAPELARDQARTALGKFRRLGASRAMDVAAGVLRRSGQPDGDTATALPAS